jgi:tRNA U34 5-methylaminomethyl-2-thiouridine-forming methyltransferase MnmC
MSLQLIQTEDGSSSLMHLGLNETYHSTHGAIQESKHVFIEGGLMSLLQANIKEISILEIGFGTGLNALLTFLKTKPLDIKVYYYAIEAFPLGEKTLSGLNYSQLLNSATEFDAIHDCPWDEPANISTNFNLYKRAAKVQDEFLEPKKFDLVYFDAFAPNKQPEMWGLDVLAKVVTAMKPQGVFVTYSAKGQLKRDLSSLGLTVEKIPGPPGKREMIRAILNL